jgi:hypothetical protein
MARTLAESYNGASAKFGIGTSANALLNKWNKEVSIINEAFNGKANPDKVLGTAILLENTERHIRNCATRNAMFSGVLNEGTTTADVSYFKQFAFNNLIAVYPNLIAPELVSSQPMLSRAGSIRYIRAIYGSNKGGIKKGDTMFGQYSLGDHPADATYSSGSVEGELLGTDAATTNFNLSWTPVIPGTVEILSGDGTLTYRDDSIGGIVSTAGAASGSIDYATGKITFTAAPAAGFTANYEYDNVDTLPIQAPEIQVKIVETPVYAKSRKLKTLFSFDSDADLSNDFGISLSAEILSMSSAQLKREIDDEIIIDLSTKGTAPGTSFDATVPDGVSLVDHYAGFPAAVAVASNNIWNATQVGNASWIIVGQDAANIVEAIPRFKSLGVVNPKGSHLAGYLGNLPVYKSTAVAADAWVVGYKGDSLFEAGYIWAPYLPIEKQVA